MGKLGWLAAFFFAAATALRLARFNTQIGTVDKRYFQGLPCPAAGATVAGLVWFAHEYGVAGEKVVSVAFAMTIAIAGLMVSNVRFHSFKNLDLRGRVPFVTILVVVALFVFVSSDPPSVLFIGMLAYVVSGPILTLWMIRKRRAARRAGSVARRRPSARRRVRLRNGPSVERATMSHPSRAHLDAIGIPVWVRRRASRDTGAARGSPVARTDESGSSDADRILDAIDSQVRVCRKCDLHRARTRTVFGVGRPNAQCMFVGEAPGAEEDARGRALRRPGRQAA